MAGANQSAAGIDRYGSPELNNALFDRFPGLARVRNAEVIDCHVLGCGEAVVGFDSRHLFHGPDACSAKSLHYGPAGVRQHVRVVPALRDFGIELHRSCAMAPTQNAWDILEPELAPASIFSRVL